MDAKLEALGIRTCADLRAHDVRELEQRFGRYGRRLAELALGIDERAVNPDQPVQSISAEDTFEHDVPLERDRADDPPPRRQDLGRQPQDANASAAPSC